MAAALSCGRSEPAAIPSELGLQREAGAPPQLCRKDPLRPQLRSGSEPCGSCRGLPTSPAQWWREEVGLGGGGCSSVK